MIRPSSVTTFSFSLAKVIRSSQAPANLCQRFWTSQKLLYFILVFILNLSVKWFSSGCSSESRFYIRHQVKTQRGTKPKNNIWCDMVCIFLLCIASLFLSDELMANDFPNWLASTKEQMYHRVQVDSWPLMFKSIVLSYLFMVLSLVFALENLRPCFRSRSTSWEPLL